MRHVASMSFTRDNQYIGSIASSKGQWKIPIPPETFLYNDIISVSSAMGFSQLFMTEFNTEQNVLKH